MPTDLPRWRGTDGDVQEEWATAKRPLVSAAKATRDRMIALAELQNVSQGAELFALAMRSVAKT
eukprot:7375114-Pyramimonas_sp.AAC.1